MRRKIMKKYEMPIIEEKDLLGTDVLMGSPAQQLPTPEDTTEPGTETGKVPMA